MNYKKKKLKDGSTRDLHRLSLETHIGRRLSFNEVVHHKDGDKTNNSLDNLEIMTRSDHSRLHVTDKQLKTLHESRHVYGEECGSAKLNEEMVREIRRRVREGYSWYQIWKTGEFPVTGNALKSVALGKSWKHVN